MSASKIAFHGSGAPVASFEVPLEMLSACHGRVEDQCQTMLRLVPHLAADGPDRAARTAAQNVMRYFDTSAKQHHADEEEDLFPALLRAAPESERAYLIALIDALLAQHRELELTWGRIRRKLEELLQGANPDLGMNEVERMVELYRVHIAREEEELLPLAARLLDDAELGLVGRAMRLRRGIKVV